MWPPGEKELEAQGRESLSRALDFHRAAEAMLAAGNLNAAGLLAVNAGKSAVNAVTLIDHGVATSDGTFMDVVRLVVRDRDRRQASLAIKLGELLGKNSSFGHGRTKAAKADARRLVKLAARVVADAEEILRKPWTGGEKALFSAKGRPNLPRAGRRAR